MNDDDDPEDVSGDDFGDRWERVAGDEHLEFKRIPEEDRLHPSDDICGLLKLYSLLKPGKRFEWNARHDEIFFNDIDDFIPLTDADKIYLARCGIRYSREYDCLATFT